MTIEEAIRDAEEVLAAMIDQRDNIVRHIEKELDYAVGQFSDPTMMPEARADKMFRWEKQETRAGLDDIRAINYAIALWRQHLNVLLKVNAPDNKPQETA
jgi:hypothetical protein